MVGVVGEGQLGGDLQRERVRENEEKIFQTVNGSFCATKKDKNHFDESHSQRPDVGARIILSSLTPQNLPDSHVNPRTKIEGQTSGAM